MVTTHDCFDIGLVGATLARAVQDFLRDGSRHDYQVALTGVTRTT